MCRQRLRKLRQRVWRSVAPRRPSRCPVLMLRVGQKGERHTAERAENAELTWLVTDEALRASSVFFRPSSQCRLALSRLRLIVEAFARPRAAKRPVAVVDASGP